VARGHATSHRARIDGIVLSATRNNECYQFHAVLRCHPSEKKAVSSVQSAGPSTPTNLATSTMGQILWKYCQMHLKHCSQQLLWFILHLWEISDIKLGN